MSHPHGGRYVDNQTGVAVAIDFVMIALFASYLITASRVSQTSSSTSASVAV